jgi:hypothetical protein
MSRKTTSFPYQMLQKLCCALIAPDIILSGLKVSFVGVAAVVIILIL